MDADWLEQFVDFGNDPLLSHASLRTRSSPLTRINATADSPAECKDHLRRHVALNAPKTPGVYGMLDASGRLLYVGKSKLLRNRLLSYFLPGNADEKSGRVIQHARSIVWETQPNEFAALLREQSLIRRWQPRLNVVGMPNRQQSAYLCLGKGPAEQFYIARQWDPTATQCCGPFFGAGQLSRAVEVLNRMFLLRDCSPKTPTHLSDQLTLFELDSRAGCLRAELQTCLAPCQWNVSRSRYQEQEALAARFLAGDPQNVLHDLEHSMHRAAAGRHFERAARLREDLRILTWLTKKLWQHRVASQSPPCVYLEPYSTSSAKKTEGILYLLRRGGVEYALACPKNDRQWQTIRRDIQTWMQAEEQFDTRYCRSLDSLGLVTAWFQKQPKLKHRLLEADSLVTWEWNWNRIQSHWLQSLNA